MFKGETQLGISVSDRSIEMVEVRARGKQGKAVSAVARATLTSGIVERGAIADEGKFVAALKRMLVEAKPEAIRGKRAVLSLPDAVSFLHVFRFPPTVTHEEMQSAVRIQAEELIPITREDSVSDFVITEHGKDHVDVLYVAVDRAIFTTYVQALKAAGVDLNAVSVDAASLSRLVSLKKDSTDATLVVDLGARSHTLLVVDELGIRSSFSRFEAGEAMTQAVAETLRVDATKAEALKIKNGLTGDAKIKKVLQPFVDRLSKDILATMDWHEGQHDSRLKELILVGGSSLLLGLIEEVGSKIGLAHPGLVIRLADPWLLAKPDARLGLKKQQGITFAPALGAALLGGERKEQEINLLSSAKEEAKELKEVRRGASVQKGRQRWLGLVFLAVLIGAGIFLYLHVHATPTPEEAAVKVFDGRIVSIPFVLSENSDNIPVARSIHTEGQTAREAVPVLPSPNGQSLVKDEDLTRAEAVMIERIKTGVNVDGLTAPALVTVTPITTTSIPLPGEAATTAEVTMVYNLDVTVLAEGAVDAAVRQELKEEGETIPDAFTFSYVILEAAPATHEAAGVAEVTVRVLK